jgi:ubiquinone/menaquinone biosynthesis C-methylase UbiE
VGVTKAVLEAAELQPGDRLLDVGCGHGDITLVAARRIGPRGLALGVDESAPKIERARRRACEAGLANVGFLHADVRTHRFSPLRFDVIVSQRRLTAQSCALANLAAALRPGGRLILLSIEPESIDADLQRVGLVRRAAARMEAERMTPWLVTAGARV